MKKEDRVTKLEDKTYTATTREVKIIYNSDGVYTARAGVPFYDEDKEPRELVKGTKEDFYFKDTGELYYQYPEGERKKGATDMIMITYI